MKIKQLFSFFLSLLISFCALASALNVDSLKTELQAENPQRKVNALLALSNYFKELDSAAFNQYNNELSNINLTELPDTTYIKMVRKISTFLKESFQYQKSIDFLKRELILDSNLNRPEKLALIHELLTPNYYYLNSYDTCLIHLDKAYELYEELGDTARLGIIALRKSGIYNNIGNYSDAIDFAFEAVQLHKLGNNQDKLATSYLQLGNIFYFLEDFDSAKRYYELSSKSFFSQGDLYGYYQALSNIGLVEYKFQNYTESLNLHQKALDHFRESKHLIELGNTYGYLSESYLGLENFDSSWHYSLKALEIHQEIEFLSGICAVYITQMEILERRNEVKEALKRGLIGYAISIKSNSLEYQKQFSKKIADFYELLNNTSLAYKYLKKYDSLNSALNFNPAKLQPRIAENILKLEETEFELQLTKEREKLVLAENQIQDRLIKIVSIVAGISLLLLIIAIYFNRKSKRLNSELLRQKNHIKSELELKKSLLSEIHHRVKNNLQIISSMLSLQANYTSNETLEKVIAECRGRIVSMSLIHESLYKKIDENKSCFGDYIEELIPLLINTYKIDQNKIKLDIEVDSIVLPLDESIPCGLVINEIVSNALKHAFPGGRDGTIKIKMFSKDGKCHLIISDDGVGFPKGNLPESQNSFGFLLIYTLASQLESAIEVDTTNGVKYVMSWKSQCQHPS